MKGKLGHVWVGAWVDAWVHGWLVAGWWGNDGVMFTFEYCSGVDLIKVGCKPQIIEIALSICTLHIHPTF